MTREEKIKIIEQITKDIVAAIVQIGLPVAWLQVNDAKTGSWTGYFVQSKDCVIALGCAEFLGKISLGILRLDHLVGILENGIRETDESNRYDDVLGQYRYLEKLAKNIIEKKKET